MTDRMPIRRALVSVYDKRGCVELGRTLVESGCEIISTGSTARHLADAGLPVTPIDEVTGFPECLDGRVKTLHPNVHAGILADRGEPDHMRQLRDLGVSPFDLVVCNLYPFASTVASGATAAECVEQIDIGGPTMIRAAAKNHACVAVVSDVGDYAELEQAIRDGGTTLAQRRAWAGRAFRVIADYDIAVANWFVDDEVAQWRAGSFELVSTLRYGENSHQRGSLYADGSGCGLPAARQLNGKQLSFNNLVDADAARRAAYDFDAPAVAVVKHANPCGIAVGVDVADAHRKAHACDPVSAFGGVIAANRSVSVQLARQVAEIFTEVIVAPSYEEGALEVLRTKKNLRVLECDPPQGDQLVWRQVDGGLLIQDADRFQSPGDDCADWRLVAGDPAGDDTMADLRFAWRAVRSVKSNAILLASGQAAVGIGMGQVNRVDSCELAVRRAGDRARGSVAASDAFFPFADGPQILADAHVRAIVQPGGSVRDDETIALCQELGVTMYFTETRHFLH